MNSETAVWIVGAIAVAVIGALVRAGANLFVRVRELEADRKEFKKAVAALEKRPGSAEAISDLRRELADLRLEVARSYIGREEWVPMTSRVMGMLESHSEGLARLEERLSGCKELHLDR